MVPIDMVVALWAVLIALFSGLVHGYAGFRGAFLMVPLLALFLSPLDAVTVTAVAALIDQASVVRQAVQDANWAECARFLAGAVVAMGCVGEGLSSDDPRVVVMAGKELLDRGYAKPAQSWTRRSAVPIWANRICAR